MSGSQGTRVGEVCGRWRVHLGQVFTNFLSQDLIALKIIEDTPVQFSRSVVSTLCDPMNHSTPDLPVHHQLLESTQTHVHRVGEAIQPSHPLSSPSSPALNLSHHQCLFKWISSEHQVAKYWSFSCNISPSNEHPGLISFKMDWLDILAVQGRTQCPTFFWNLDKSTRLIRSSKSGETPVLGEALPSEAQSRGSVSTVVPSKVVELETTLEEQAQGSYMWKQSEPNSKRLQWVYHENWGKSLQLSFENGKREIKRIKTSLYS